MTFGGQENDIGRGEQLTLAGRLKTPIVGPSGHKLNLLQLRQAVEPAPDAGPRQMICIVGK